MGVTVVRLTENFVRERASRFFEHVMAVVLFLATRLWVRYIGYYNLESMSKKKDINLDIKKQKKSKNALKCKK